MTYGHGRSVAAYRRVVVLYPRSFRREYGEDLVALFADQLRDERAAQVWARTIRDLVTSVPLQRMEAFMRRPSDNLVAAAATTVSIVCLVLAATAATPAVLFAAAAG